MKKNGDKWENRLEIFLEISTLIFFSILVMGLLTLIIINFI